jgi:hypothetical protein
MKHLRNGVLWKGLRSLGEGYSEGIMACLSLWLPISKGDPSSCMHSDICHGLSTDPALCCLNFELLKQWAK